MRQDLLPALRGSGEILRNRMNEQSLTTSSVMDDEDRLVEKMDEIYRCQTPNCGYLYNPDKGDRKGKIPKGTSFADLPADWKCPICGTSKKMFLPLMQSRME